MCNGLFIMILLTFVIGYFISAIDYNLIIPQQFNIDIDNDETLGLFYLLFGAGIVISIELIIVILGLLMIKNKKLYCKIYCKNFKYLVYMMAIAAVSFILGGVFLGILFSEYFSLFVCQVHIKSLDAVYKENQLEIENYNNDDEEEINVG